MPNFSTSAYPNFLASVLLLAIAGDKGVKAIIQNLPDLKTHAQARTMLAPKAHHVWNCEHPELFSQMVRCWVSAQPLPEELRLV